MCSTTKELCCFPGSLLFPQNFLYKIKISPSQTPQDYKHFTHQSTTAQEDHKDDESLKPIVLHNQETSFPQGPPRLSQPLLNIDLTTLAALHTAWNRDRAQLHSGFQVKKMKFSLSRSSLDVTNTNHELKLLRFLRILGLSCHFRACNQI